MKKLLMPLMLFAFVMISTQSCKKDKETCSDGERNQTETGVDCGGPCEPCATCTDGIKNQGETDTDCGGPCGACVSCSDGIKNQGETDVDCGGPCAPCNYLCTGKSSETDYIPLKDGNRWTYINMSSNFYWEVEGDYTSGSGMLYKHIKTYQNGINMGDFYLRYDTNGDLYYMGGSPEELMIPGNPTVNQTWAWNSGTKKVASTNATVTSTSCTYSGVLEIHIFDASGTLTEKEFYKKGLGKVKYTWEGSWPSIDYLDEVTLN